MLPLGRKYTPVAVVPTEQVRYRKRVIGLGAVVFRMPDGSQQEVDVSGQPWAKIPEPDWTIWNIKGTMSFNGISFRVTGRLCSHTGETKVDAETLFGSVSAHPVGFTFLYTQDKG